MNSALIPEYIAEQAQHGRFHGELECATLFLDISGFTSLTSALMKHGKHGAELISRTINTVFSPMIDAVYANGGFVSVFAGDAFTAVFPEHVSESGGNDRVGSDSSAPSSGHREAAVRRAVQSANACRAVINREHLQHTRYGEFSLEASIGIGSGVVQWGIVGPQDGQWSWYFRGQAILSAVNSEAYAGSGDIVVPASVREQLEAHVALTPVSTESGSEVYRVRHDTNALNTTPAVQRQTDGHNTSEGGRETARVPADNVQQQFRPLDDIPVGTGGEFRDVVSAFVAVDPGESHDAINETVSCIIRSAQAFGGYFDVLDFGDKGCVMLILFGAPRSKGRDSERATAFANEVLESLGEHARAGLSRGTVFTGYIGSSTRGTYTALGEQVNLAARIALSNPSGTAFTDEKVTRSLESGTTAAEAVHRSLKGIETPVALYRLVGTTEDSPGAPETAAGMQESPDSISLVGRNNEKEKLANWVHEASRDESSGLTVIEVHGEAGIGKTMLVREMLHTLEPPVHHVSLRADPILSKSLNLFDNLVESASELLGIRIPEFSSGSEEAVSQWAARIQQQAESVDASLAHRLRDSIDALPVLIGSSGGPEYERREPRARLEMTVEAIIEMVRLAARSYPGSLVIVLDDLQVADEDSYNALERLLFDAADERFTLIGIYRDDESQTGEFLRTPADARTHMLRLTGLNHSALTELSTRVLGGPAAGSLADFLASRVGGNPFYATEMLRYLSETGKIRNGASGYEPTDTDSGIPEGISSILVERLDSLPAQVRRISHVAALIGLEFDISLLSKVVDDVDSERALEDGIAAGLWSRNDSHVYVFSQRLIRDAIVSMQLDSERRRLHGEILTAIHDIYGEDPVRAAELAYHAEASGDTEQAVFYLWRAYEYARDNFKNAKAVDFLYRYLAQCDSHSRRLAAYMELGSVYELTGDWGKAAESLTFALGVSVLCRSVRERITVLTSLSRIYQRTGKPKAAVEVAGQAVELAENDPSQHGLAQALLALGRAHWSEGKLGDAETYMARSARLAAEQADGKTEGLALYHCGVIRRDRNDFAGALELYKQAEAKLTAHADSQLATFPVYDMAVLLQYEGDLETSQQYFERVLDVYRKTGYRSGAAAAVLNLGVLRDRRGDFEGAIEYFEESREIAESIGEQLAIAYALFSLGATYYKMFENRKALSYLKDALRLMRNLGAKGYYAFPLSYLAALYSRAGDTARVISMCAYHLSAVREVGSDPENGLALLSLARLFAKKREVPPELHGKLSEIARYYEVDSADPDSMFRKTIELSGSAQYVNTLIPANYHYARYLRGRGDEKRAREHLREAYRLAKAATWERFLRTLESRHSEEELEGTLEEGQDSAAPVGAAAGSGAEE